MGCQCIRNVGEVSVKTVEEIVSLYTARSRINDGAKARMRDVRDYYNGDVIVPLPELDADEKSAVANLLSQGLDQTAMRIASTAPDIYCPPTDPSKKRSRDNSSIRRKALSAGGKTVAWISSLLNGHDILSDTPRPAHSFDSTEKLGHRNGFCVTH